MKPKTSNSGAFNNNPTNLARGEKYRFKTVYPSLISGTVIGELVVVGVERRGLVRVQCSCNAPTHLVMDYNLRGGKTTRCNTCAKKQSDFWRKSFYKYAEICPDITHRRRLMGRLAACKNRCHSPADRGYANYGGRGITLYEPWHTDRADWLRYVMTLDGWDNPKLELDRIDVNKGYEPNNLRFVTRSQNQRNRRSVQDMQKLIDELKAEVAKLTEAKK